MNKLVKDIGGKLFIVENFIFPETCEFLIDVFSKKLNDTDKVGIAGGPGRDKNVGASKTSALHKIENKSEDSLYNIGIDFFTSICTNIEKTVSLIFKKDLVLKSYFYSHMTDGGKNPLHFDNYSEDYAKDYSAVLYLSDNYDGGLLNFSKISTKLKPNPGTLLTFIGTEDLEHEVQEVISGNRVNIICFLNERENNENQNN